ncbi:bile acid:sodium symporter family protein [Paenibacillus sp. GCM10023248]|nr:bile acid:sodium symporter family protein [Paenibacillus sp. MAHUQ-63]MDD9268381.1 bile acid:sodium symporter family protein [Paenibacillus sp. MAHUQ-63]MDR6879271.1 putative Na+-dependent transporter [Bacillus sp. 3255]
MLTRLNKSLEKLMPVLTPAAVVTGLVFSVWLHDLRFLVTWIFAGMTFAGSLGANFADLKKIAQHPQPIIINLIILHLIMPLVGWLTAKLVFPGDLLTETGFILLFAIPTGVVSLVWVTIYKGNVALTLALILLDTIISPFVVPYTVSLFVGAQVSLDTWGMMKGLLWMVVIPSILGMTLNQATKGRVKTVWGPKLSPFSKLGLFVVVAINASVVAPYIKSAGSSLIALVAASFVAVSFGYALGWAATWLLKWNHGDTVALTFNSGMRNLSAGAVLAITFFPPPVVLPVISGMLFQQILASLFGFALGRTETKRAADAPAV